MPAMDLGVQRDEIIGDFAMHTSERHQNDQKAFASIKDTKGTDFNLSNTVRYAATN